MINFRRKRGFTLVELMVTIGIIALLAILLFPALTRSLNTARQTTCAGNLRQIYVGFCNYAQDNDGTYPVSQWNPDRYPGGGQQNYWAYALWTYVGYSLQSYSFPTNDFQNNVGPDNNVFACPVTKRRTKANFKAICVPTATGALLSSWESYGMNVDVVAGLTGGIYNNPIHVSQVKRPSTTALLTESQQFTISNGWYASAGLIPHGGGSNTLFYDGHVSWLPYQSIPKSGTDPYWGKN